MRELIIDHLMIMLKDFHHQCMRWDGIRLSFYKQIHPNDISVDTKKGKNKIRDWIPCKEDFVDLSDEVLIEVYNLIFRKYCAQY